MDIFSLAVGFLVGAATGAAGNYIADRCTDFRRSKEFTKEQNTLWTTFEKNHISLIAEMRTDLTCSSTKNSRAFYVKSRDTELDEILTEPSLEYHTDKHPNLQVAILFLEEHGFITNITTGNCPKYRIHHRLVEKLSI